MQASGSPSSVRPLMHLAERGGGGRLEVEFGKTFAPVQAKLRDHPAADEARAHRRRLRLQADEFVGVVGRQRVGDGGQDLRHLHQRPLHGAQRRGEGARVVVPPASLQAVDADPGRERPGADAESGVALRAGGKAVGFVVFGQRLGSMIRLPLHIGLAPNDYTLTRTPWISPIHAGPRTARLLERSRGDRKRQDLRPGRVFRRAKGWTLTLGAAPVGSEDQERVRHV